MVNFTLYKFRLNNSKTQGKGENLAGCHMKLEGQMSVAQHWRYLGPAPVLVTSDPSQRLL